MTVILTLSNSDDWERIVGETLTQRIRDIGDTSKVDGDCIVSHSASMDDLHSMLSTRESVLLVYPSIESCLSSELKSGVSEGTAVSKVINFAEELLKTHRGARRKLKLVNMRHLGVATEDELHTLSEHGWNLSGSPDMTPDDVFVLGALQLIRQNKKLNKCTELLAASSLPLSQSAGYVNVDSILNGYKALALDMVKSRQSEKDKLQQILDLNHALSQRVSDVHAMQNERDLLQSQLVQVQEELEKYFFNASNAEEQLAIELEQRNRLQNELSVTQKKRQQLASEYDTLEARLLRIEESKRRQHSAHIRELVTSTQQVMRLENELVNIKKSGYWKIGAPARVVGKTLSKFDKKKNKLQQDIGLLYTSDLFDADWYLETYPDIADAGVDPAEHYLKYGAEEGRLPSAYFDGNWYLQRYPDIADSKLNPLIHYLKFGQNEGRTASPKLLENSAE